MRARGIQSVRSPTIRWPTMSKALQVFFSSLLPPPSLLPSLWSTQRSGRPRSSAFRVAGVRVRMAMASARLNFVRVSMSKVDAVLALWTQGLRSGKFPPIDLPRRPVHGVAMVLDSAGRVGLAGDLSASADLPDPPGVPEK